MLGSVGSLNLGWRQIESTAAPKDRAILSRQDKAHKYFKHSQGLSNRIGEDKKVSEALCALSQGRWSMSDTRGSPCGPREFEEKADLYIE